MTQPVRGIALSVELEDFSGRSFRWDADASDPKNRPQGLYFRTQRGDGFADAGCNLYRPIDKDFPDLGLLYTGRLISQSGDVVYEGRITGTPRQADPESQQITVNMAGWMSHGNDRTFQEIYVDKDLGAWGPQPRDLRIVYLGLGFQPIEDGSVVSDAATPALVQRVPWSGTAKPEVGNIYNGKGVAIGSIYYAGTITGYVPATANTVLQIVLCEVLGGLSGSNDTSSDLEATSFSGTFSATTGTKTSARAEWLWTAAAAAGNTEYNIAWTALQVFGNHGLTKRGTAPSQGFYASDLVQNIVTRFCPKLQVGQIDATSYVIGQLAFKEQTKPYAAIQQINNFHQYELSVWEDRKFYFTQPTDMTDWDWEVRVGDPGVKLSLQGDSIEDVANGIVVNYTDLVTGDSQVITPETNTSLADTSATNPANLAGIQKWIEITVPFATLAADAAQIGIAALAEFSRPKSPGTIEVGTQLRDRQGNWQPAYKVRCGERVILSGHPNDAPRRIIDTRWNDTPFQQGLSITVDNTSNRLDALLDRIQSGRSAAGIG